MDGQERDLQSKTGRLPNPPASWNSLVPRNPDIRILAQNLYELQSSYHLDHARPAVVPQPSTKESSDEGQVFMDVVLGFQCRTDAEQFLPSAMFVPTATVSTHHGSKIVRPHCFRKAARRTGDPQKTRRIKGLLEFVDGQTTNPSLIAGTGTLES